MSEIIRIHRSRVVEYEVEEYVTLTAEQYAELIKCLQHEDGERIEKAEFEDWDSAIDEIIGQHSWETDSQEPADDRVYDMRVEKE